MKDTYTVKFSYEGTTPMEPLKSAIEYGYVGIYNIFCELVNPMYEKWNDQYEGPNDGFDENDRINPNSVYNSYIREKQMSLVEKFINPAMAKSDAFKKFFIGPECDLRAELLDGTVMQMFLE